MRHSRYSLPLRQALVLCCLGLFVLYASGCQPSEDGSPRKAPPLLKSGVSKTEEPSWWDGIAKLWPFEAPKPNKKAKRSRKNELSSQSAANTPLGQGGINNESKSDSKNKTNQLQADADQADLQQALGTPSEGRESVSVNTRGASRSAKNAPEESFSQRQKRIQEQADALAKAIKQQANQSSGTATQLSKTSLGADAIEGGNTSTYKQSTLSSDQADKAPVDLGKSSPGASSAHSNASSSVSKPLPERDKDWLQQIQSVWPFNVEDGVSGGSGDLSSSNQVPLSEPIGEGQRVASNRGPTTSHSGTQSQENDWLAPLKGLWPFNPDNEITVVPGAALHSHNHDGTHRKAPPVARASQSVQGQPSADGPVSGWKSQGSLVEQGWEWLNRQIQSFWPSETPQQKQAVSTNRLKGVRDRPEGTLEKAPEGSASNQWPTKNDAGVALPNDVPVDLGPPGREPEAEPLYKLGTSSGSQAEVAVSGTSLAKGPYFDDVQRLNRSLPWNQRFLSALQHAQQRHSILLPRQAAEQFQLNQVVTRREFARWLLAYYRLSPQNNYPSPFVDVPDSHPDKGVLSIIYDRQLLPFGTNDQGQPEFRPDDPISRAELCYWYVRFADKLAWWEHLKEEGHNAWQELTPPQTDPFNTIDQFVDFRSLRPGYQEAAVIAYSDGLLRSVLGVKGSDLLKAGLQPNEPLTRGQAVVFLDFLEERHAFKHKP